MARRASIVRIRAIYREPVSSGDDVEFSGESSSLADMVFGFPEASAGSPDVQSNEEVESEEEERESSDSVAKRQAFWVEQHQLVKSMLRRRSSLESRVGEETERALRELRSVGPICICRKPLQGPCRNCLLRDVSDRLRNAGFDSAICKSKWRSSPNIPSGEHTYVDVMDRSGKNPVRLVVETDFRSEFEMARGSHEYNDLLTRVPLLFVGKPERLKNLVKILCSAAKECMKENKMHMAPWRKHKYMRAKWLGTCERMEPSLGFSAAAVLLPHRQPRTATSSMLTFDLSDDRCCMAVEVV